MTLVFNYAAASASPGLNGLSSSGNAGGYCKACDDPDIIPIYPARIAWNDLFGEVNGGLEYPSDLGPFPAAGGAINSGGFTLRKLRAGTFYIFDETNAVWSVFHVKPDDTALGGRFDKLEWLPGMSDWLVTEMNLLVPYVRDDAETIHVAFSEHGWSSKILMDMQNNTGGLRDKAMTKVVPTAPSHTSFSAPLEELGAMVEEFSPLGISQTREDWETLSDLCLPACHPDALLQSTSVKKALGKPILVAVHDPMGVALEIATSHLNRTSIRAAYLEANVYPLTAARAVDTLQNTAVQGLADRSQSSDTRRMFREWQDAVDPAYKTFLTKVETQLQDYDIVLKGVLDAWEAFYKFGMASPGSEPGSLSTHLMLFNAASPTQNEVEGLLKAAHASVASFSASRAGQARMRSVVFSQANWDQSKNPVGAAVKIT